MTALFPRPFLFHGRALSLLIPDCHPSRQISLLSPWTIFSFSISCCHHCYFFQLYLIYLHLFLCHSPRQKMQNLPSLCYPSFSCDLFSTFFPGCNFQLWFSLLLPVHASLTEPVQVFSLLLHRFRLHFLHFWFPRSRASIFSLPVLLHLHLQLHEPWFSFCAFSLKLPLRR